MGDRMIEELERQLGYLRKQIKQLQAAVASEFAVIVVVITALL